MNINATLIGQMIVFVIFVWFCMKFVWPPIMAALQERTGKIADGLAAAERGKHEQELAEQRAKDLLKEAKEEASGIIAQAQKRASEIVDEAKDNARGEGERLITAANAEIEQEVNRAREHLRGQVVSIAVAGAAKVLNKEIDDSSHDALLQDLVAEI
ncbi:F0F1 ATP synthase subunit B [Solemya pervernicosa gill symbiont]|uniref:ATP synthase subunit b n=2 Tax=Gammaproteobacteria incertae sedis TaxID=118884 RepID=A0A1T2L2R5_9GAMM|nr:F0F1 ATP synthase subunit B [Candidatus Reidiella endopervernicosa]OOZ39383.1 F0F1 ATP synthase subunit B [Solemya pervernicosa gill symbiont]QKQ25327.1 F0F1 ATP synthase subunit B [Candidatus Reidiella endopervernicosa]